MVPYDQCPFTNRKFIFRDRNSQRIDHGQRHKEKVIIYKPEEKAGTIPPSQPLEGTNPANTLILDF